jgi:hypothetical protein
VEGSDLRDGYSDDRVRLARLSHWRGADDAVELSSLEGIRRAYEMRAGVVWMHWDVSAVGLEPGSSDLRRLHDAEFLTRLLSDAFAPQEGDPISRIIKWRLNLVGTRAFGGLSSFEGEDEGAAICMFDAEVFDVAYSVPSEFKVEIFRDIWRRALLKRHRVAGIAVPFLLITIRNDNEPVFFDEDLHSFARAEEDGDRPLSGRWQWSDRALAGAIRNRLSGSRQSMRSGDALVAIGRECVEAYEGLRSWLLAEAEEVELARVAPHLIEADLDQIALAHRHAWLLQQASRVRAALDWGRLGNQLPVELFGDPEIKIELEQRRGELLVALTGVRNTLRSALDLVATASTAEQLELSREDAARSSTFQSAITFVTTVLLAPGLVAAVFGAMPSLLEDHPLQRFVAIVVSMALAGGLAGMVLRSISRDAET